MLRSQCLNRVIRGATRNPIAPISSHRRKLIVQKEGWILTAVIPALLRIKHKLVEKNSYEINLLESADCQLWISNPLTVFPTESHKIHSWDRCKGGLHQALASRIKRGGDPAI